MNAEQEAKRLLELVDGSLLKAVEIIERQLNTLYTRAQVLLSLAGVTITVTGFSGRIIANTSTAAQVCIIAGLMIVLGSVVWVFMKVMNLRWVTMDLDGDERECLETLIERRNEKTSAYVSGGALLCLGLIVYAAAVALMLLFPEQLQIPAR